MGNPRIKSVFQYFKNFDQIALFHVTIFRQNDTQCEEFVLELEVFLLLFRIISQRKLGQITNLTYLTKMKC